MEQFDPVPSPKAFLLQANDGNYFRRLGLPDGAPTEAVDQAGKALLKRYHPDVVNASGEEKRSFEESVKGITEAWQTLKDPDTRSKYLANSQFSEVSNGFRTSYQQNHGNGPDVFTYARMADSNIKRAKWMTENGDSEGSIRLVLAQAVDYVDKFIRESPPGPKKFHAVSHITMQLVEYPEFQKTLVVYWERLDGSSAGRQMKQDLLQTPELIRFTRDVVGNLARAGGENLQAAVTLCNLFKSHQLEAELLRVCGDELVKNRDGISPKVLSDYTDRGITARLYHSEPYKARLDAYISEKLKSGNYEDAFRCGECAQASCVADLTGRLKTAAPKQFRELRQLILQIPDESRNSVLSNQGLINAVKQRAGPMLVKGDRAAEVLLRIFKIDYSTAQDFRSDARGLSLALLNASRRDRISVFKSACLSYGSVDKETLGDARVRRAAVKLAEGLVAQRRPVFAKGIVDKYGICPSNVKESSPLVSSGIVRDGLFRRLFKLSPWGGNDAAIH
jgi:hypothetical protein